jgi:signal transduction histidine kinase
VRSSADAGLANVPEAEAGESTAASTPAIRLTRFLVGASASGTVVILALAIRLQRPSEILADPVPLLVAAGALCAAALLHGRAPGGAWFALVVASFVAAHVPIAISRAADPGAMDLGAWIVIAVEATAAAVVTMVVAAMYATRPERRSVRGATTVAVALAVWLAAACLLVIAVVLSGGRNDPAFTWLDVATGPTAFFFHLVLLLTALGVAGDLRAASERACVRQALAGARAATSEPASAIDRARAIVRELIPGEADADDAAIEAERTSLAGELHASVIPELRRAIADAESGGTPDALADRLRAISAELDRLMTDRWPVVLDSLGLVAAMEELAERVERDSTVRVDLDVDSDDGTRPHRAVERAGWRIAQLAVDNAARHSGATSLRIRVAAGAGRVLLSVADDGRGMPGAVARRGGRGIPDMEASARAVGGRLRLEPGPVSGTIVTFAWPSSARFGD